MNELKAADFIRRELRLHSRMGSLIAHNRQDGPMMQKLRKQYEQLRNEKKAEKIFKKFAVSTI